MLGYAVQLTRTPHQVNEESIEALRSAGWTDDHIIQINLITAYFNFVNRIALGLGVTCSKEEVKGYNP